MTKSQTNQNTSYSDYKLRFRVTAKSISKPISKENLKTKVS